MSAIDMQLVGWPLPASDVERTESMRSRVAMFFRAGDERRAISVHTVAAILSYVPQQFAERDAVRGRRRRSRVRLGRLRRPGSAIA